MVKVNYIGRLGNQLFQYCFGRIMAEETGMRLCASPIPGFPGTQAAVNGRVATSPNHTTYSENVIVDFDAEIRFYKSSDIPVIVSAYMQRYEYYKKHREKIRSWLAVQPIDDPPGPNDLVIHVRLGDFVHHRRVLAQSYIHDVLKERDRYQNVWIVTDEPFSSYFHGFSGIKFYRGLDHMSDFRFIMSAKNIVLSASTFCWWAACLSNAEKVLFPVISKDVFWWNSICGRNPVDLWVPDSSFKAVVADLL